MRGQDLAWIVVTTCSMAACATAGVGSNPSLGGDDGGATGSFFGTDEASAPDDSSGSPLQPPSPQTSGSPAGAFDDSGGPSTSSSGSTASVPCPMDLLHDIEALIAIGQPACPSAGCASGQCCYSKSGVTVCVKL
jgi:hypothetical protein